MAYTVFGIALIVFLIASVLCIIALGIANSLDCDGPIALGIIIFFCVLCVGGLGTSVVTYAFFSDDIDAEGLQVVKTSRRAQLLQKCPEDIEGICHMHWIDYKSDSLHAEYKVLRNVYGE